MKQQICNTTQNDAFFMLNMNNFMSSHDGSVQVAFENKSFQVAKKANPDLGEGFIPQCDQPPR